MWKGVLGFGERTIGSKEGGMQTTEPRVSRRISDCQEVGRAVKRHGVVLWQWMRRVKVQENSELEEKVSH